MDTPDTTTIWRRLRAARLARGLTPTALGAQAGLTQQQATNLEGERVRSPAPHVLRRLSYALDVPFTWLLTGDEDATDAP